MKSDTEPMNVFFLKSERKMRKIKDLYKYEFYLCRLVNFDLFLKIENTPSSNFASVQLRIHSIFKKNQSFLLSARKTVAFTNGIP